MSTLSRLLGRELRGHAAQLLAVALVVACGTAVQVSMLNNWSALRSAQSTFYREHRFADVFAQLLRAPQSLSRRIEQIPGVAEVTTRVVQQVPLRVPGLEDSAVARLVSLRDGEQPRLNRLHVREGRLPARHAAHLEVVASEGFARAHGLQPGDSLRLTLNGALQSVRVVGVALSPEYVFAVGGGALLPDDRRFAVLWMEERALATAFDMRGAFNDVCLRLAPGASQREVIAALDRLLLPFGGLDAHGREDQISHRFLSDEIAQNRVTAIFIPTIFFAVAAYLLNLVLARLVVAQRAQIGLLKALGYSDARIALHYLGMALLTAAAGGALGLALGAWVGRAMIALYRDYYRFPILEFELDAGAALVSILVALIAALVGAGLAARQAARLPPAEAMRPPAPTSFHSLPGSGRWMRHLRPAHRMIVRQILRRPARALLTCVGIGFAVGILVLGRFMFDAFDVLMEVQFSVLHREDVSVQLMHPRPEAVLRELSRMPGVRRIEGVRAVAVRLVHGARQHRVLLEGIAPDALLRRPADRDGQAFTLPTAGLTLSRKLAELLDLQPGQQVRVEVLEGRRAASEVEVSALIDDLLGLSALMPAEQLSRLLREDAVVNAALLAVDPDQIEPLQRALRDRPLIAGVGVRQAMIDALDEAVQRSVGLAATINVAFAAVIAFGMVYNGSRIALAERGHELATLRVLGFREREVAALLVGEQAILTVLAIPLGFGFGVLAAAAMVAALNTELYRFPLQVSAASLLFAAIVVMLAAAVSAWSVTRRLRRFDLVETLKSRE